MYLWQAPDWPRWRHDAAALQPVLSRVRLAQGRMLGLDGARPHGRDARTEATLELLQIVTPRIGKPDLVHHEAPPSSAVPDRTGSSAG